MQKSATLNIRVDPEVKQSAESILSQLGLSMSTAVDIFLRQVSLTGGLPFKVTLPKAPHSIDASHMSDREIRDALSRGLSEAEAGEGDKASGVIEGIRQELFDA